MGCFVVSKGVGGTTRDFVKGGMDYPNGTSNSRLSMSFKLPLRHLLQLLALYLIITGTVWRESLLSKVNVMGFITWIPPGGV